MAGTVFPLVDQLVSTHYFIYKLNKNMCPSKKIQVYSQPVGYDEFKRHLGKAGLTVREFAHLLKLHSNSVSNYARLDQVPSHLVVVAALLGEMAEHGLDFRPVLERLDIQPKKSRGAGAPGKFGGDRQMELEM
ncbi:MAG: XRE family transcriptional regulator [Pseudomonadota bacterium]|jgi:hypothetical protein